jgi:DNA-binding response OmpR family regulator
VIIALTASAFETERRLILSEGCDDFVRKPFVEDEIYEKLEQYLGVHFLAEEAVPAGAGGASPSLTPELVASLPLQWRSDFRQATVEADFSRMQAMMEETRSSHRAAVEALLPLVNGFEYKRILDVLDAAGPPRSAPV